MLDIQFSKLDIISGSTDLFIDENVYYFIKDNKINVLGYNPETGLVTEVPEEITLLENFSSKNEFTLGFSNSGYFLAFIEEKEQVVNVYIKQNGTYKLISSFKK